MTLTPTPARRRIGIASVLLASLLAWGLLHRHWFLSGDDYLFIADPSSSGGRFSAAYWWASLADDWGNRNGRLADGVLRLVLRPGPWFYPLFAPVMLTAVGTALALLLRTAAGLRRMPVWLLAAGLSVVPMICWLVPALTGDVILWTAAAINYTLPLGMLAGSLALLLTLLGGRDLPWWAVGLGAVLVVLTDALQEVTSSAMFLAALAVVVALAGRLGAKLWTLVGAAAAAFAVHMSAGGLWNRSSLVVDNSGDGFLLATLRGMATSVPGLWTRAWPVWLVLIAALALHGLQPGTESPVRRALLTGSGTMLALALVCGAYRNRYATLEIAALRWVLLVDVVTVIAFLAVGFALLKASKSLGHGPLLVWVAFVGSGLFPFASGSLSRTQFVPLALLTLAALTLAVPWLSRRSSTEASALVALALVTPALLWFDLARVGAAQNRHFVDTRIVAPLEAAAATGALEVQIPELLPHPSMAYSRAFYLERYEQAIADYYGLADGARIVNP